MCTAVIDMCQPPGQDERMGGWTINWKYCIMIGLSFCLEEVCKPKHVREPEKKNHLCDLRGSSYSKFNKTHQKSTYHDTHFSDTIDPHYITCDNTVKFLSKNILKCTLHYLPVRVGNGCGVFCKFKV